MKTTPTLITRRLTVAALTAALAVPLAATSANAEPIASSSYIGEATFQNVQWNNRRDNRGRGNRNRRNRNRDWNRGRNNRNVRQTFSGVAVSDNNGNQFQMRVSGGRIITVIARQSGQARKVDRGDRVTVAGYYRNNNVFDAEDLNFIYDR